MPIASITLEHVKVLETECKSTLEHIKVLKAECKSKSDDQSEPDIIGDIVKTLRQEHKSAVANIQVLASRLLLSQLPGLDKKGAELFATSGIWERKKYQAGEPLCQSSASAEKTQDTGGVWLLMSGSVIDFTPNDIALPMAPGLASFPFRLKWEEVSSTEPESGTENKQSGTREDVE